MRVCPKCKALNDDWQFCSDCGTVLGRAVVAAPIPTPAPRHYWKEIGISLGLAVPVLFLMASKNSYTEKPSPNPPQNQHERQDVAAPVKLPKPKLPAWTYERYEDEMGRKRSLAIPRPTSTLSFDFPYAGEQTPKLMIRKSHMGTEILLEIERGQFICHVGSGCVVEVRFDDGPVTSYLAGGPSDYSSTLIFIKNAQTFIAKMKMAKAVRIEATFYNQGSKTMSFDVEGFDATRL